MKLSEAILLGDSLKSPDPHGFLNNCGACALGGALIAIGRQKDYRNFPLDTLRLHWPWFTPKHFDHISDLYHEVCQGKKTIEQIADYVRTIEPAEEATPQTEPEALLVAASVAQ